MAQQPRTHVRVKGKVDEGRDNEDGLSALLLIRALRQWPSAEVSTNVQEGGVFDDIVLLLPTSGSLFMQAKHKSDNFYVSSNVLKGCDKKFGLKHYFDGFRDLWNSVDPWRKFNIDRNTAKFILYTNAKVGSPHGPPVEKELLDLLNTGTPDCAYYLDRASHSYLSGELATEFFDRFIIFSEQTHAGSLPLLLQQEIALSSGIIPGIWGAALKFCKTVQRKNRILGDITFMYANSDCVQTLKASISKETRLPDGVYLEESVAKSNGRIIQEALLSSRAVRMLLSDSSTQVRSCVAVQCIKSFSSFPVILANADNMVDAMELWLRTPSTLVVDEEDLSEIHIDDLNRALSQELPKETQVLFLSASPGRSISGALSKELVELKVSLSDLDSRSRSTLLSAAVLLQGAQKPVSLFSLAPENVWPSLGANCVSALLKRGPPIALGSSVPSPPLHYIQREFRLMVPVNMDIMKDPSVSDILLIVGENDLTPDNCSDRTFHHYPSFSEALKHAREHDIYTLRDVHRKFKIPVHRIDYEGDSSFLADTIGGVESLMKYIDVTDFEQLQAFGALKMSESDVLSQNLRLLSVSSDPGMGKTSFLLESARRIKANHPNWWVFVLFMNRLCKQLAAMRHKSVEIRDVRILLERAAEILPQSTLASQLAHNAVWETGKSAVFIDGFDEIAPDYVDVAEAVIRVLVRSPVKLLWLSTRPVTRDQVKKSLGVASLDLEPLTSEQQLTLLMNSCQGDKPELEQRIKRILYSFIANPNFGFFSPITGSPLVIRLLAEMVCDDTEQDIFDEENLELNLFDLYNRVLKRTFKLFLEEKQKKDLSLPAIRVEVASQWKQCLHKHSICALSVVLPSNEFKAVSKPEDFAKILEDIRGGEDKHGFLAEVLSDQPRFVHLTVAEFFAAKWISENWRKYPEIARLVFFDSKLKVVRYFLNEFFVENFPFHRQILRNPSRKPDVDFALKHLHIKDDGGRTPLHIAAQINAKRISELLVKLGASMEEKEFCGMTPLYYAAHFKSWNCVRLLVDCGAHVENNFLAHRYVLELRKAGVPIFVKAFEANWPLFPLRKFYRRTPTIFQAALDVRHEECYLWFRSVFEVELENDARGGFLAGLQERKYKENVSFLNQELLQAVQSENNSKMEWLFGRGADVATSDADGNTPLHIAARSGKTVLIATLVRRGADLNAVNSRNQTPEMVALEANNVDAVELIRYLASNAPQESVFMTGLGLIDAASRGQLEEVRRYLLVGASTTVCRYPKGSTALHEAACNGHVEVVSLLCKNGADVDVINKHGDTPLRIAAKRGNASMVCCLIENGANKEYEMNCPTPLHEAAKEGHVEVVRILVNSGANLEANNGSNDLPIHLAASAGHSEVVRLLLQAGASPDTQNYVGETPLHLAARNGQCGVIDVLMSACANTDLLDKHRGCTPFHACVQHGHTQVALLMINKKPGFLTLPNTEGNNAIHGTKPESKNLVIRELLQSLESARQLTKERYGDTMDLMIEAVEDRGEVSSPLNRVENSGLPSEYFESAFLVAAGSGSLKFVRELLDAGIDKNAKNKDEFTALHFAAAAGQVAVIQLLLEEGVCCNTESFNKMTPLKVALEQRHEEAVLVLLGEEVQLEDSTQDLGDLLREAARNGMSKVVEKLLSTGADCNAFVEEKAPYQWREWDSCNEPFGITALHLAAENGHEKVVSLLLAKGASVDIRDKNGGTALLRAWNCEHHKVAELLIKAGADEHIRDSYGDSPWEVAFRPET